MPDNRTLGNAALVLDYTQIPELAALVRSAERRLAALERVAQAARGMELAALPPFADGSVAYSYEHEQWWAPQLIDALAALDALKAGRDAR